MKQKKNHTEVSIKALEKAILDLHGCKVPIPLIPATQSEGFRPAVPIEGGHLFRSIPATLSERSDAGI
jgi:hypothetical protein